MKARLLTLLPVLLTFITTLTYAERTYLNREILSFARDNLGKTIGRGECWDLAARPLRELNASWDQKFAFGHPVGSGSADGLIIKEGFELKPGDIIQFKSVYIKETWRNENSYGWRSMSLGNPWHTAVIEEVLSDKKFQVLHQNASGKRYVTRDTIDLTHIQKGSYIIYRPYR